MDNEITAWERVQRSRDVHRLSSIDYIQGIFSSFVKLHGDRLFGEDRAIIGGIARLHSQAVTVIGTQKGRNTKENILCNFGMPRPEGYRKAIRLMKQAEKFKRPVICFVDTPGAYCGMEAEERGQGEAIARNLYVMSGLKVPILSIFIGEGGSGGALALGVSDEVWMLENATYSILSPEGFAAILWQDSKRAPEAANLMKMTAEDLKNIGVIDKIIKEENNNQNEFLKELKYQIQDFLERYKTMSEEQLLQRRYERFRSM